MMQSGNFSIKFSLRGILILLGLINILTVLILYFSVSNLDDEINLSAENAMLTQKMTLYAYKYAGGDKQARSICRAAIEAYENGMDRLENGGIVSGSNHTSIDKATGEPLAEINHTDSLWQDFKRQLLNIIEEPIGDNMNNATAESLQYLDENTEDLMTANEAVTRAYISKSKANETRQHNILLTAFIISLLFSISGIAYLERIIIKPLNYIITKIKHLAEGNYDDEVHFKGKNEFGTLGEFLSVVFNKFRMAATFIEEIGKGNLSYTMGENDQKTFQNDRFFVALNKTREELKNVEEQNKIRQWTNEGITEISELLQKRYDDIQNLYDDLIATIVKYVGANQGGIFIEAEKEGRTGLELKGCYAYERKKHLHELYDLEEGLLGQSYKEGQLLVLTEVPENYVNITSGLGKSTPKCLVLIPLVDNENKVGVLEIALFQKIEDYKTEFLQKISELIASSLNSIMINERTKELLSESQQQAEEMRAQEEEMRQNMEELQATQEEMARKEKEASKLLDEANSSRNALQEKMRDIEQMQLELELENAMFSGLMDILPDRVTIKDTQGTYLRVSKAKIDALAEQGITNIKGKSDKELYGEEHYSRSLKVEKAIMQSGVPEFNKEDKIVMPDGSIKWGSTTRAPFKTKDGDVLGSLVVTRDITDEKLCKEQLEIVTKEKEALSKQVGKK